MKRSELRRKTELVRVKMNPRRIGLAPMSAKRRKLLPERARVRQEVLARDGGCRARGLAPGPCGALPDRSVPEAHELKGGSFRSQTWLDACQIIALCPRHHEWVTEHPIEAKRLGLSS